MYLGWEVSKLLPLFQFIAGFNLRNPYEPEIFWILLWVLMVSTLAL